MSGTTSKILVAAVIAMLSSAAVRAQEWPGLDLSGLVSANLAFDQQMDQSARSFANQWYWERQRFRAENNYWGPMAAPFTTQDLVNANNATSQAYGAYNESWARNSAATSNAIGNYSQQAIRGLGNYGDGAGNVYQLSNQSNAYYLDNQGYAFGSNTFTPPTYSNWYTPLYQVQ